VTHVVRGADLLDSTARQILLQRLLGYPQPVYAHLPVATNPAGEKLSKQTLAAPITSEQPVENLWRVLHFLAQNPPAALRHASLDDLWQWALGNWDLAKVPRQRHSVITP
jgi:glutamyl-Q tRNA(Asp) synthetase